MRRPTRFKTTHPDRGLRSGLVLATFCLIGTLFACWVTFEGRHASSASPIDPIASSNGSSDSDSVTASAAFGLPNSTSVMQVGTLQRRSTPLKLLIDLGAEGRDAHHALKAIYDRDLINPRRLPTGLPFKAYFAPETNELLGVSIRVGVEKTVMAKRLASGEYFATDLNAKLTRTHNRVSERISTSLYESALNAGLKDQHVADFAQTFAFDVDFQREVRAGDSFEIVYESFVDEQGKEIRSGNVIYASFQGKSTQKAYYRHTPEDDGTTDYFTQDGKSATRFLMKTPINGARLSSSFGRRRHPISGYTRLHKGTDFAARGGTPIFAAGNGVVERASRYGGYGKYVRIQHANGYETAYAHMSRYGGGIKKGKRVRQGDIIGYVGSTGASTGPHLHYEVIIRGKHVNALRLKLPTGRTLDGELLDSFNTRRVETDRIRSYLGADVEIAALTGPSKKLR